MTIVEAGNKLLEHFSGHNSFCMEEDYLNLMNISENPNETKIAFILALEDLEKNDFIRSYTSGKKKIYILKRPLNSFDQNVTVGGFTCVMISKVINDFCNKIKDHRDFCDPKSINEKDLRNLIFIANMNTAEKTKNNEDLT